MSALFSPITQNNVLWKHVFDASPAAVHFAFESSRRRCMSLLAKQCHYGVTKAKTGQKNKQVNKRTSASARRIPTNAGVQLKLFATPHPLFKVNISVSDWMLYLAYSKLLKPAEASNAGEYEKLAILDEYLVDHCQMRLRLITIWTTVLAYCTWSDDDDTCRRNKRRPLMNGTATHEWTIVYDASHRSYVEYKLYQNILPTPYLKTTKDILAKWKTPSMDRALPSCKFSRRSARDICPLAKVHIFLIGDSPGGYRPTLYIFGKLSSSQCYAPFDV